MRRLAILIVLLVVRCALAQDVAIFSDSIFEGYPFYQSIADNTTGIYGPTLGPQSNWKGTWSSGTAYVTSDGVIDAGVYYNCTSNVGPTGTHPASDAGHWQAINIQEHDIATWIYTNSAFRYTATNYGREGWTSDGVYSQDVLKFLPTFTGRFVVYEVGDNDINGGGTVANFINAMQLTLDRCQQYQKYLLVADVGPDTGLSAATITNYNVNLYAWAATQSCVTVMNWHKRDADPNDYNNVNPAFLNSMPHLNVAGTSNAAYMVVNYLDALVGPLIPAYRSPGGYVFGNSNWWQVAGVDGGIPAHDSIATNTTLTSTASAATISSALTSCPSNQCVLLGPGTFYLSSTIINDGTSGAVLRGCGMTNTILVFTNSSGQGLVELHGSDRWGDGYPDNGSGNESGYSNITGSSYCRAWTSGYAQGSSNITINLPGTNSTAHSSLFTNIIICLDQLNDWNVNLTGSDGFASSALRGGGARAQQQYVRVTSIYQQTNLTIWPPIYATNWQASLSPNIWWWGTSIVRAGVEDLTIVTSNNANTCSIMFWGADNCWAKNIRFNSSTVATYGYNSKNTTITGCFINDSLTYGSGSYGIVFDVSGDPLVENNAINLKTTPITWDSTTGGVCAYNFCTNSLYITLSSIQLAASIQPHYAHDMFHLYEGNWGTAFVGDFIHGSQASHTLLRNRFTGRERSTQTAYLYPIYLNATNYWVNVIGNVLGVSGVHTNYQFDPLNLGGGNLYPAIYALGFWGDSTTPNDATRGDTNVAYTVLRHGNYDVVTSTNGGVVWDANTPNHTIPNSMFFAAAPAEFTAGFPWPPFDALNPSAVSPTNLPAYYIFTQNPSGGGSGPSAPSGVSITGSSTLTGSARIGN